MKFKQFIKTKPVASILLLVMFILCCITLFFNWRVAIGEFTVFIIVSVFALLKINSNYNDIKNAVVALNENLSYDDNGKLRDFPLPIIIFDSSDKILWYNILFKNYVMDSYTLNGNSIGQFTLGKGLSEICKTSSFDTTVANKRFTVFYSVVKYQDKSAYALYFIDDTELKNKCDEYDLSKPVVSLIAIDSIEEIYHSYKESECAEIVANVERMTENWFSKYPGIFRKLGSGRFLSIVPESELDKMIENKFDILEQVRTYAYNDNVVGLTLSVGTGRGNSLSEAENSARQALDMALGRGGDQLALKNLDDSYRFFGGVSDGVEKRTKVRTRVVASALEEVIENAENVLIMGHKFSDLDSLGSAVGVLKMCSDLGTEARIVISSKTSLATPLIRHIKENNLDGHLVLPDFAEHMINKKTLLVIVDTHRADFVESKKIYEKVPEVIVIDHHRKTVDHIANSVIFYHEPHASSTCEMVTELMQYISKVRISPVVANALLSGIMLDTKDFVLRTGTRTFEAAAYLRSKGADTVTVKRFFNNSLESQKLRSKIVMSAYEYKECAISIADLKTKDIRLVSAQAADELLTINNVNASFVLFMTDNVVNISARSMGSMNVQVIMESFGGGGHQTMAACQIENGDIEEISKQLEQKIDEYYNSL